MKRRILLPVALGAAGLAFAAQSSAMSAPKLKGTVGPGFTIKLVDSTGKKVTSLKSGKYTFVVADKASIHNFVLEQEKGGKFEKDITGVGFTGSKTMTINLTKGKWKFYCRPHESSMFGNFTVT
jgi:plastocyanin